MGYKEIGKNLSFADLEVSKSLENSRSLKMMEKINKVVKWKDIEALLMEHYQIGKSEEGADAYPPLVLLKCMLLQKWFRIPSDPELEHQNNDRISFKKFLGLSLNKPSPDHSTFSRFRSRVSKQAMIELNNVVLQEFAKRGLSINEGIPAVSIESLGRRAVYVRSIRHEEPFQRPHYFGQTKDLSSRLKLHNEGKVKSTKRMLLGL